MLAGNLMNHLHDAHFFERKISSSTDSINQTTHIISNHIRSNEYLSNSCRLISWSHLAKLLVGTGVLSNGANKTDWVLGTRVSRASAKPFFLCSLQTLGRHLSWCETRIANKGPYCVGMNTETTIIINANFEHSPSTMSQCVHWISSFGSFFHV